MFFTLVAILHMKSFYSPPICAAKETKLLQNFTIDKFLIGI